MKEIEAIRKLTDEAVAALNRGDVEASVALQSADASVLAPMRPAETGSADIRASLEALFKRYWVQESRCLEEVEVNGTWAFTRGSYESVLVPKEGGTSIRESGKYLEILKQDQSGAWRFYRTMWNSNG